MPGPSGPKGVNWMAVRTAYVVRGWTAQRCADEFGLHVCTVKKRAIEEQWTAERTKITTQREQAASDEARELVAAVGAELRAEHAKIVAELHKIVDGIEDDLASMAPGRSRLEARKAAAETIERVLRTSRLTLGIVEGQNSADQTQDIGERAIVFEEVAESADEAASA